MSADLMATAGQPLRYGVVGYGRVFERFHLPCLQRPEIELVAICDLDLARAAQIPPGPSVAQNLLVTADLDEFIGAGRLDAISVCTPNDAHLAPVAAALDAGAAVLCEKPLAANLADARGIAGRAAAAKRPFGVNLPYRFHPLLPEFAVATQTAHSVTLTMNTPGHRFWRPCSAWYDDPVRAGGGALLDLAPHVLDLLGVLLGPPRVTSCVVDRPRGLETRAELTLDFGDGRDVRMRIDRASRRPELTVTASGPDGDVVFDLRRNELRRATGRTPGNARPAELAAVEHFVGAVLGERRSLVGADEALALQELIEDAYHRAEVAP
jgi:predicted dehydrogenase